MKQRSPAAARNREPIRDALAQYVLTTPGLRVLELASGTGEHAVHLAAAFPDVRWQPSDVDPVALASIESWRMEAALPNLVPPIVLDVTAPVWPVTDLDAIVCMNMIHISPWQATLGLFAGAARTLLIGGLLFVYGPFRFDGETAPSNEDFDRSLRGRDPRWGVRDLRDLRVVAEGNGFSLEHIVAMPANNHALVFERRRV